MINVTKHDQSGNVIAQATVATLDQARKFLDSLQPDGSMKPKQRQATPSQQQQACACPRSASKGLPELAYVQSEYNQAGAPVIAIKRGERGFYPIFTKATAAELNESLGVTPEQAEAMHVGSMFGWDVPGANPATYAKGASC